MKHLTITLLVALALTVLVTPAQAAPETVAWQPCSSVAPDWADVANGNTETESTTVGVPGSAKCGEVAGVLSGASAHSGRGDRRLADRDLG